MTLTKLVSVVGFAVGMLGSFSGMVRAQGFGPSAQSMYHEHPGGAPSYVSYGKATQATPYAAIQKSPITAQVAAPVNRGYQRITKPMPKIYVTTAARRSTVRLSTTAGSHANGR